MDELYPKHAKALQEAKLAPEVFPTMGEILDESMISMMDEKKETPNKKGDT